MTSKWKQSMVRTALSGSRKQGLSHEGGWGRSQEWPQHRQDHGAVPQHLSGTSLVTVTGFTRSPVIAGQMQRGVSGSKFNQHSKLGPARTGLGESEPAAWLSLSWTWASGPMGSSWVGAGPRPGWSGHLRAVGALGAPTAALMWARHGRLDGTCYLLHKKSFWALWDSLVNKALLSASRE